MLLLAMTKKKEKKEKKKWVMMVGDKEGGDGIGVCSPCFAHS